MSSGLCLWLDANRAYALARGSERVAEFSWSPQAPAALVEALRREFGAPSSLVVIVGLAFLEIAQPNLPPVPNEVAVRMLQRDSDRFFALHEPAAVATDGQVALAMPASLLTAWVDAFTAWSPVRAVFSIAQAAALSGRDGRFSLHAASGEIGEVTIAAGRVQHARRMRASGASPAPGATAMLSLSDLSTGVWRAAQGAVDGQLLDAVLRTRTTRQRTRRWWQSVATVVASMLLLGWSADRWRTAELVALRQEVQTLEAATTAARAAQLRLRRAEGEHELLDAASAQWSKPDTPPAVLAQLGRLLPNDAFIQRLEWNGLEWRIDGSASDAAALVPLLDADAGFDAVRSAAPSTRYVEAGRPRSSFSIAFITKARAGS